MAYRIISKKIKYRGFWAKIEELDIKLPDGRVVKWENIISDDAVAIVALDKEKNIYLAKEWRPAWQREVLQIPSGMCASKTEKGIMIPASRDPGNFSYRKILKQARNELREEIGLDAKKWEKFITFFLGGRHRAKIHIFLAQDLYKSAKEPDEGETIEVVKMPFAKACRDFLSGKILTTGHTLVGLALARERYLDKPPFRFSPLRKSK
ncbi:MAG: NUDIX hydrolase [Patescibacteria group bacterium]